MIEKLDLELTLSVATNHCIINKINELVDTVNELTDPCQDPKAYKIMKEKDEIIARHIQEKNDLQRKLDIAVGALRHADWFFDGDYIVYAKDMQNEIRFAIRAIEQINNKEGGV